MDFGFSSLFVDSEHLRQQALQIRRECFAATPDADAASVQDDFDLRSNAHTYLLVNSGGTPIGTIRFCIYSAAYDWEPIPALETHPDELAGLNSGSAIVQSTYFSVTPRHQGAALLPKLLLIREFIRSALSHQASHAITFIRNTPTWISFFKRLGFRPIGIPRVHPWAQREGVLIGAEPLHALRSARSNPRLSAAGALE